MHVKYAIIANAAIPAGGGKWTIVGTFNTVRSQRFPAIHPQIALLIRIEGHHSEAGKHQLRVDFVDELGQLVNGQSSGTEFALDPNAVLAGTPVTAEILAGFPNGIQLPKAGNFDFAIHVDDTYQDSVPLYVRQVDAHGKVV